MRTNRYFLYLWLSLILLCLFPSRLAAESRGITSSRYVFLVSIDGLSSEAYAAMKRGGLQVLANEGVLSEKSVAIRSSDIAAAEASLLTGRNPEDHGAKGNGGHIDAESLFDVLKKNGKQILVVDGSNGRLSSFAHGTKEYLKVDGKNDLEVMKKGIERFSQEHPFLTYVYLGGPRQALEKRDRDEYYVSLDYSQKAVGHLLYQLKSWGIDEQCLIVVTSSRSSSPSHLVPIIMRGPGLKSDYRMDGMQITDLAATICAFNDLPLPYGTTGVVPWSVLATRGTDTTVFYQEKQIKDLYRDRLENMKLYYRLQDQRNSLVEEVARAKREQQSIFDFVGERDRTVSQLQKHLIMTRWLFLTLIGAFLLGYYVEYRILKRYYRLF